MSLDRFGQSGYRQETFNLGRVVRKAESLRTSSHGVHIVAHRGQQFYGPGYFHDIQGALEGLARAIEPPSAVDCSDFAERLRGVAAEVGAVSDRLEEIRGRARG